MTDDPALSFPRPQDLVQLRARAAVSAARVRELIAQSCELQERTALVRAENARLLGEVRLLQAVLDQVDPFS